MTWLRYIDCEDNYCEFPSLETQDAQLNPWQISAQSVDVEVNVNVAPNVSESRADARTKDEDD